MESNDRSKGRRRASRRRLHALLAINGLLLLLLATVTFGDRSVAQTARARGEYTMVAANIKGAIKSSLFVVDSANQELMAVAYDPNRRELIGVGYRNLAADTATIVRGGSSR